jgi:hypothetical protein
MTMKKLTTAFLAAAAMTLGFAARGAVYHFDTSGAPKLAAWTDTKLRPVVEQWYPRICSLLQEPGFKPPEEVKFCYREDRQMRGIPAWTMGNAIWLNRQWFEGNLEGEAIGCVVHEMVHVAQAYRRGRHPAPSWVQEGIADYVRWFLYEPYTHGARPNFRDQRTRYDNSYRTTAHFLNYVELKYGGGNTPIYRRLNAAARNAAYSDEFWKVATGKDVAALDAEWKQAFARPPRERRQPPKTKTSETSKPQKPETSKP